MNTDIKNLIDKYYSGETSLEEEKQLRNLLSAEETKGEEHYSKLILNAFCEEKAETAPISLKTFSPCTSKPQKWAFLPKKWLYITSGIAACLVVAWGIIFYQHEPKDTAYLIVNGVRIDDEKRAIEEVNKQFAAISCQINKGLDALRKVEENERNVEEKIKFITNNIINN